jgi:hypothetical protein
VHDRLAAVHRRVDRGRVGDVAPAQLHPARVVRAGDRVEQRAPVVQVEHAHVVAAREQRARGPRADEPQAAGDQHPHQANRASSELMAPP